MNNMNAFVCAYRPHGGLYDVLAIVIIPLYYSSRRRFVLVCLFLLVFVCFCLAAVKYLRGYHSWDSIPCQDCTTYRPVSFTIPPPIDE